MQILDLYYLHRTRDLRWL